MTFIAEISSTSPFIATHGDNGEVVARTNSALAEFLDGRELDHGTLLDILDAGIRALTHVRADSTVSAMRAAQADVRRTFDEARQEWAKERETLLAQSNSYAASAAQAANSVIAQVNSTVQGLVTSLPTNAQQQLAPQLDRFRQDLVAHAAYIMDPANGGAGASLAALVKTTLDDHHERHDRRITEMETLFRLREQAVVDREKMSAKGDDFEEELLESLDTICSDAGLTVRCTAKDTGAVKGSKKGDFVIYGDGDVPLVAVEAKNRNHGLSGAETQRHIDEMLRNRGCAAALWVTKGASQNKGQVLRVLGENRWSVALEEGAEGILKAAVILASTFARRSSTGGSGDVDTARVKVQEAIVAAGDLAGVQTSVRAVVDAADKLQEKLIPLRTRITNALNAAAEALGNAPVEGG